MSVPQFLEGCEIILSGMPDDYKEKAKSVLNMFGAKCVDLFSPNTGVLVVGAVGTKEFSDAVTKKEYNQVIIVTKDWVRECQKKYTLAKYSAYKVPPFYGLVVTCTEVTKEERDRIESIVNANGGKYSASFFKDKSTHLIAKDGNSEKFSRAKEWRKRIVTTQWVDDCVKNGCEH